jgi:hypothetical protein
LDSAPTLQTSLHAVLGGVMTHLIFYPSFIFLLIVIIG